MATLSISPGANKSKRKNAGIPPPIVHDDPIPADIRPPTPHQFPHGRQKTLSQRRRVPEIETENVAKVAIASSSFSSAKRSRTDGMTSPSNRALSPGVRAAAGGGEMSPSARSSKRANKGVGLNVSIPTSSSSSSSSGNTNEAIASARSPGGRNGGNKSPSASSKKHLKEDKSASGSKIGIVISSSTTTTATTAKQTNSNNNARKVTANSGLLTLDALNGTASAILAEIAGHSSAFGSNVAGSLQQKQQQQQQQQQQQSGSVTGNNASAAVATTTSVGNAAPAKPSSSSSSTPSAFHHHPQKSNNDVSKSNPAAESRTLSQAAPSSNNNSNTSSSNPPPRAACSASAKKANGHFAAPPSRNATQQQQPQQPLPPPTSAFIPSSSSSGTATPSASNKSGTALGVATTTTTTTHTHTHNNNNNNNLVNSHLYSDMIQTGGASSVSSQSSHASTIANREISNPAAAIASSVTSTTSVKKEPHHQSGHNLAPLSRYGEPLKFFNNHKTDRLAFRRRDAAFMTSGRPLRGGLAQVFVMYSDFFPELVGQALHNCRQAIRGCAKVYVLRKAAEEKKGIVLASHKLKDEVVLECSGEELPREWLESPATIIRTVEVCLVKMNRTDRKRGLLPVEEQLCTIVHPLMQRFERFARSLINDALNLDELSTPQEMGQAIAGLSLQPWSFSLADRSCGKIVYTYNPQAGVFVRQYPDVQPTPVPLVTTPNRMHVSLGDRPGVSELITYLRLLSNKMISRNLARFVQNPSALHTMQNAGGSGGLDLAGTSKNNNNNNNSENNNSDDYENINTGRSSSSILSSDSESSSEGSKNSSSNGSSSS